MRELLLSYFKCKDHEELNFKGQTAQIEITELFWIQDLIVTVAGKVSGSVSALSPKEHLNMQLGILTHCNLLQMDCKAVRYTSQR